MLELRPICENCRTHLPPESKTAMICSFECTFCRTCVEKLENVCPNCGGGFTPRPIRPKNRISPLFGHLPDADRCLSCGTGTGYIATINRYSRISHAKRKTRIPFLDNRHNRMCHGALLYRVEKQHLIFTSRWMATSRRIIRRHVHTRCRTNISL